MRTTLLITKEKIISVAQKLFIEMSFYGTTMKDIANAAKISRRTLYTHFNSRPDAGRRAGSAAVRPCHDRGRGRQLCRSRQAAACLAEPRPAQQDRPHPRRRAGACRRRQRAGRAGGGA